MKPTKQTRLTSEPKTEKSTMDSPQDEFIEMQSIPSIPETPPPPARENQEESQSRRAPLDPAKKSSQVDPEGP